MLQFDLSEAKRILKREQIPSYDFKTFKSPFLLSIHLLKSLADLPDVFGDRLLLELYCDYVTDIWLANPSQKDNRKKEQVKSTLPKVLLLIYRERNEIFKPVVHTHQLVNYTTFENEFIKLKKFQDRREKKLSEYTVKSNPYITILIGESLDDGQRFQINAKIASSVETSWGTWIQHIIPLFNNNIEKVGAGGFDVILNNTVYDIKSGPNVMDRSQIDNATEKRRKIRQTSSSSDLREIVKVTDFKVATVYGKKSSAGMYMQSEDSGLILFSADTWKILTGDEWNAYRLFIWQLHYLIQSNKWKPDNDMITKSLEMFFECSYDQYQEKLEEALQRPEYLELINFNGVINQ